MSQILDVIDEALRKKNLSDAAASQLAVGHPALIKKLRMPTKGEKRYNYSALEKLAEVLDLEIYFGPQRETKPAPVAVIKDEPFDMVARYDAQSAAGNGSINFEGPPIDHLAFSKTWLSQNGINAGACVLINVKGDSMEPSIYDGDLVMIDKRKTEIRSGHIYVFRDGDDGLRLKRLDVIPGAAVTLRSDNTKYPPEHRTGERIDEISSNILGEVVWSGHKWG